MAKNSVEKAWASMRANLVQKTGKSMDEWIKIIDAQPLTRTSDKVHYLKKEFGLGTGYAGLIIYESKASQDREAFAPAELLRKQYVGKETLKPIYDKLIDLVQTFGTDVEIAPRNSYVSIRRKVQFAMFQPATKVRFDIMLKLRGQESSGVLEALPKPSLCTHRIKLGAVEEITEEVLAWLRKAYEQAGEQPAADVSDK